MARGHGGVLGAVLGPGGRNTAVLLAGGHPGGVGEGGGASSWPGGRVQGRRAMEALGAAAPTARRGFLQVAPSR